MRGLVNGSEVISWQWQHALVWIIYTTHVQTIEYKLSGVCWSFWSFGIGIWSHSCLIWVSSYWRVCGRLWYIFCLIMPQMFSKCERSGLQDLLRSHAVVIAAVCGFALSCWNAQGLPWNWHRLEGSICCSKTFIYLSAFIVPSKTCKLPIPYALMYPHTIADNTLEGLLPL